MTGFHMCMKILNTLEMKSASMKVNEKVFAPLLRSCVRDFLALFSVFEVKVYY